MNKRMRDSNSQSCINTMVALLSFVISVIALINSCHNTEISKQVQEPIFVQTSTLPAIEAGGDPYAPLDTIGVRFFNYGGVPSFIKSISAHRVWSFVNAQKSELGFTFFVWDFYACGSELSVTGYRDVAAEAFNIDNNKFECEFRKSFYDLAAKHHIGFSPCTLSKIEYENRLHEVKIVYFKDCRPISAVEYDKHLKRVPDDFRCGVAMCDINVTNVVDRLVGGLKGMDYNE